MPNSSIDLISVWFERRGISVHITDNLRTQNAELHFLLTFSIVRAAQNQCVDNPVNVRLRNDNLVILLTFRMVWMARNQRSYFRKPVLSKYRIVLFTYF